MPAQQQHWIRSAYLSGSTGAVAVGACLVSNGTAYVVATTANRASYGRATGIALSAGDDDDRAIEVQVVGEVPEEVTGLADGTANDWVIVSATGTLQRKTTPVTGDDIIGRCPHTDGRMVLMPGVWDPDNASPGGGATPGGSDTQVQYNDGGALGGDAGLTYNETSNVLSVAGSVNTGADPSTSGGVNLSNNAGVWANDAAGSADVPLLNLNASDVVELGVGAGKAIKIGSGVSQDVAIQAVTTRLGANAQIASVGAAITTGGGTGVLALRTDVVPSTDPPDGVILYNDAGDGDTLKYRRPDGTVVPLTAVIDTVVNVMDYYDVADGGATFNLGGVSVTTKDVSPAFQRAYTAKIATHQANRLFLPPAYQHGVTAYSWKGALTWDVSESGDDVYSLEIIGSGVASIIIPDSSAAIDDKLYIAGGGPDCMPMLFRYQGMFWCGDEDVTTDCTSVLRTSVDMDVEIEDCIFYSLQSETADDGVLNLDCMGLAMRRCYFSFCTNLADDGAVVRLGSGCFGAKIEHCQWYVNERGTNPFGGTLYDKGSAQAAYAVRIEGGGDLNTATRVRFEHCTWGENGRWGAVYADPGANVIDTVYFSQCVIYGNSRRLFVAEANVKHTILEGCRLAHNGTGDSSVALLASTCEHLTVRNSHASGNHIIFAADTGQTSVTVTQCAGGTWKLDSVVNLTIDASFAPDAHTSATAAPAARVHETAITKSDATDLTLSAIQYSYDLLNITGVPGGAFNVIGPNAARTRFTVLNQTNQACTIKKSGGTGIVVAANKCAQVYHNGTDYIRLTADA